MDQIDKIPMEDYQRVDGPDSDGFMHLQFLAFNTVVSITVPASHNDSSVASAFEDIIAACREYERLFSRTLPHSDVSKINGAGTESVEVDPRTYELIELALCYCELSQGFFDITIGSTSRLWDFHNGMIPSKNALANAILHVNWHNIELFMKNNSHMVRKLDPLLMIDLGGIAKGYIADELASLLLNHGMDSFIVNLGGNVYVHGRKPDGSKWKVGLKDPVNPKAVIGAVELENASLVTSGVYERGFVRDGVLYHHILHPKTGMPVATDALAASVVTSKSIDAEGFSTTLLAMGIEKGRAFARTRPEIIATYFVDTSGRLTVS